MKKLFSVLTAVLLTCAVLCSCSSYTAMIYSVETGDEIRIACDTSDGYEFNRDSPFVISKGGITLGTGIFLTMDVYNSYLSALSEGGDTITVISEGSRDGNDYVFYRCEGEYGTEYDFLIKIKDSQTGVLLGCETSRTAAEDCFEALTFTKVS